MEYNPYILAALAQLIENATGRSITTLTNQSDRILKLINAERAKVGAQPLRIDHSLSMLASIKSQDMVEKKYFSHHSPTYGSPFDMMKSQGIYYIYAGENLAIDKHADNAHTALMNSKAHRDNILNPSFTKIGIGIVPKDNGSYVYTQLFIGS
ncbi:MAG: hypothetical protein A2Y23_07545 [Clostridiales bacterium GWB2_37_7]|nr:MAG: hypothetical protein A2Y23_07545 [Clostridiales bacterium GWB2_37_7]